ncbi:MAG: hypothetical protein H6711_26025 [Myxococcales bacterium]|nr:hypothetical protein [Myxococcales bacterium]
MLAGARVEPQRRPAALLAQAEVAAAARALGVARATLERWIAEEPALRAALAG